MANFTGEDIIKRGEEWFRRVPSLPPQARSVLSTITPWLSLIIGILGIIGALVVMGSLPLALFGIGRATSTIFISGILTILSSGMMLFAVPKLLKLKRQGWEILFWAELVSFFASFIAGNILTSILGTLIVFYILYQIKSYYR